MPRHTHKPAKQKEIKAVLEGDREARVAEGNIKEDFLDHNKQVKLHAKEEKAEIAAMSEDKALPPLNTEIDYTQTQHKLFAPFESLPTQPAADKAHIGIQNGPTDSRDMFSAYTRRWLGAQFQLATAGFDQWSRVLELYTKNPFAPHPAEKEK